MIYAYARLSRETERSVSIDDQLNRINAYAVAQGVTIDKTFIDPVASGKTMERPIMTNLLKCLQPGDKIIVLKLDRLTRSIIDLAQLLEKGIQIASVCEQLDTSTASGRMIVNILGVFAQWERETISERTARSLQVKRENREVYGPTPFGYTREGFKLVPHEEQQLTIAKILRLRETPYGYNKIAKILNSENCMSKSGKPWEAHNVQSIIEAKINREA